MAVATLDFATLGDTGICDFTAMGRRSRKAVRNEIWYVVVDGMLLITGTPGPRHWLANVRADPHVQLHLREPKRDLAVVAEEITDRNRRVELVPLIWAAQPWYADQPFTMDEWVEAAPMISLSPEDA